MNMATAVINGRISTIRGQVADSLNRDEVSMAGSGKLARIAEALCKDKCNVLPFGGLSVLFSGDFHQLSPVIDVLL
jgi:hypothetical protein